MTTILGVTATLLLLANILQAVAAISKKWQVQDLILELHHAQTERDKAERDKAEAEKLRDRIEKAAKAVEDDREGWRQLAGELQKDLNALRIKTQDLYFRNSKGQIQKVS